MRSGLIRTPMTKAAATHYDKLRADGFTLLNWWDLPADVGRAVATPAAGDMPFTTGAVVRVDGGNAHPRLPIACNAMSLA